MQEPRPSQEGIFSLVLDMISGVTRLWRGELALAKAEAKRASRQAVTAIVLFIIALALVFLGLNLLIAAAVAGLVHLGLAAPLATLLAGGVLLLLAAVLVWLALRLFSHAARFPARQMQNLKRDVASLASTGERDET